MKQLTTYINEKLVLNKNTFKKHYNYFPKTKEELRNIIDQLLEERKDDPVIDLNDIDTSKINTFGANEIPGLFASNNNIKNIDISGWDVSNVESMYGMFDSCSNLKSVGDLSKWNVSKVTDMSFMFYDCYCLNNIGDISDWDVSSVKNFQCMFNNCRKLTYAGDLKKWLKIKKNNCNTTRMYEYSGLKFS